MSDGAGRLKQSAPAALRRRPAAQLISDSSRCRSVSIVPVRIPSCSPRYDGPLLFHSSFCCHNSSEGVVIPGMVDTHRYVSMSLTRGIGIDQHLWHFLSNTYTWWLPATGVEDMYLSAPVGSLEAIASGATTTMDTCESFHSREHAEAELQGLRDSGIRAFFCYGMGASQHGDVPAERAG